MFMCEQTPVFRDCLSVLISCSTNLKLNRVVIALARPAVPANTSLKPKFKFEKDQMPE